MEASQESAARARTVFTAAALLSTGGTVVALAGAVLGGSEPAGALALTMAGAALQGGVARDFDVKDDARRQEVAEAGPAGPRLWARYELERACVMHRWAVTLGALVVGSAAAWGIFRPVGEQPAPGTAMVLLCLLGSFPALLLAAALRAEPTVQRAGARELARVFVEVKLALLASALAALAAHVWSAAPAGVARALLGWTLLVSVETFGRAAWLLVTPLPADLDGAALPLGSSLRATFLDGVSPGVRLRDALERRLGLSLRSTWALAFVQRAAPPILAAVSVVLWGATALHVVPVDCLAFRERFGVPEASPLEPGLHVSWPRPWGTVRSVAVRRVRSLPLGFVESTDGPRKHLLWTKTHDVAELPLALGGGTELLAVNALLFYMVRADADGLRDHLYRHQDPEGVLAATAHGALLASTRTTTLDEILSTNREAFAAELLASIRRRAEVERLGIEPIAVSILSLHPSVEAAPSYLSVISSRLGARRAITEARAAGEKAMLAASAEGNGIVARARVEEERRVGTARAETTQFTTLREAQAISPEALALRLWLDTLQDALSGRAVVLLDKSLAAQGSSLGMDLRPRALVPAPAARTENAR